MAKNSIIERNIKRIKMNQLYKKKRKLFKNIRNNKKNTLNVIFDAQIILSKLPRNSSQTRIRNRCILSGRSRGVYSKFQLSRIYIRKFAAECKLPGVIKSSW